MLTTPFLHPNPHFIAYNAIRGTVTFVNTQNLKHFPGHLLSMLSTQITAKHYFFYGGFQIQNLSVKYHPDIDRWIINKKIVMSEDGYILDSSNLKFIKIRLESNKMNTTLGRVGMGVCSNIYQPPNERGEKLVLEVNLVDLLKIKDNHCHQLFLKLHINQVQVIIQQVLRLRETIRERQILKKPS